MDPLTTGLLIALMVASFYFLIIRPNRKRQAEQVKLADSMQPGTRVLLNSGIYGTVADVGEKQVRVELAPGVEVLVLKQAVLQVVTPGSQFAEDAPAIDDPAIDDPAFDHDEWPSLDDRVDGVRGDDPRLDNPRLDDPRLDDPRLDDPRLDDPRLDDLRFDDTDPRGNEGQKG